MLHLGRRKCSCDESDEGDVLALEDLPAVLESAHRRLPGADGRS